jgi:xylulokinase
MTGYTVSKLLWMQQTCPQDFARIRHILLPHEYLNWWLTGVVCAEAGDASGTAFFDPRNRTWSREILDFIDGGTEKLFAALPQLIESNSTVGRLRPEVADKLGLTTECLVSSGGWRQYDGRHRYRQRAGAGRDPEFRYFVHGVFLFGKPDP